MPLTAIACKQAKPDVKARKLFDGHGLFLHVMPNSAKYWRLKYQYLKKEKLLALGVYPEVSLEQARGKQAEARKLIANGEDPAIAKLRSKRAAIIAQANSFESIAREWYDMNKAKWIPRYALKTLQLLERDIFPEFGKLPITDVSAPDVLHAVRKVEQRDALDVASRVKQRCSSIFAYAIATGRAKHNPASELRGVLKTREVQHRKHLPASELPQFLRKLDENKTDSIVTLTALKITLLTFVRTGELRFAKWQEIDFEAALWRIPAEHTKMKREHFVPLAKQTLHLLRELQRVTGNREHLFPNAATPTKCMSENAMLYSMYRMGYHSKASPHGFRGTASTILNEMGFRPDVIERQLSHQEKNDVRRAYNHAQYIEERSEMMQHWADYLDSIRHNQKVVFANFRRAA
jgi:integrase